MDPAGLMLSELSQAETQILHSITYMCNFKKKSNSQKTDSRKVVARGCEVEEIGEMVKRHKLPALRCIRSEALM